MAHANTMCTLQDAERNSKLLGQQLIKGYDDIRWLAQQDRLAAKWKDDKTLQSADQLRIESIDQARQYLFNVVPDILHSIAEYKNQTELVSDVYAHLTSDSIGPDVDHEIFESLLQDIENANKQLFCQTTHKTKYALGELKKKEDSSKSMVLELQKHQEISKQANDLRSQAKSREKWGFGCAVILPVIGGIPAALLYSSANKKHKQADYHQQRAMHQEKYERQLALILQPGLESLIEHSGFTSGWISLLNNEIEQLCKVSGFISPAKAKVKAKKASDIIELCERFERLCANSSTRLLTF